MKHLLLVFVLLTACLWMANAASAQTDSVPSTDSIPRTDAIQRSPMSAPDSELKTSMIVWAACVASDQITTYRFSSTYPTILHEKNPLISGLNQHPALLVAAGTAMDVATGWAAYHFLGQRHPRLARMAFYAAAAYRSYLAVHNMRMMDQAQRIPRP